MIEIKNASFRYPNGFTALENIDLTIKEGEKVAIDMTVEIPGPGMTTKAMADTPTISSMRVVVFGSSGFLKESVEVEDLQSTNIINGNNNNSTYYTFIFYLKCFFFF